MIKVVITTECSNYTQELGDQDQPGTIQVDSMESYTFNPRGDSSGMAELRLVKRIREFLEIQRLHD